MGGGRGIVVVLRRKRHVKVKDREPRGAKE
jgi:hypothetical protein